MSALPCSPACERNRDPILAVLREVLQPCDHVLEIGSGTGQHAAYFAAALPHLVWHTSDLVENHAAIQAWVAASGANNLRAPLMLAVASKPWPLGAGIDAAFSANTAHIMSWAEVCQMFAGLGELLPAEAPFCLYGPFNEAGRYSSDSNRQFDSSLRQRDARMGLRDLVDLTALAADCGFALATRHAMPANNELLVWRRRSLLAGSRS
jgi:cyclopropane fatty-acyl-phospholipid synthase-like methyltransferase